MNSAFQPLPPLTSVSNVTRIMVASVHFVLGFVFVASLLVVLRRHIPTGLAVQNLAISVVAVVASVVLSLTIGWGILHWRTWSRPLGLT